MDDEVNVLSPLCNPFPTLTIQFDTSSPKYVNINRSGPKSDMDLCHSSPNVNMNKLDDTKNILNTSQDNRENIVSVQDERSVTKEPSIFNYKISLVVELLRCEKLCHSCK